MNQIFNSNTYFGNTSNCQFPNNNQQFVSQNYLVHYQTPYIHGVSNNDNCSTNRNYQISQLQTSSINPFLSQELIALNLNQLQYSHYEPQSTIHIPIQQSNLFNNTFPFSLQNTMNGLTTNLADLVQSSQQQIIQQKNLFNITHQSFQEQQERMIKNNSITNNNQHLHFFQRFENTDNNPQNQQMEDLQANFEIEEFHINQASIENEIELESDFQKLNTHQIPHTIEINSELIENQENNLKLQTQMSISYPQYASTHTTLPQQDIKLSNQKNKDNFQQLNQQFQETKVNQPFEKQCKYKLINKENNQKIQVVSENYNAQLCLINNDSNGKVEIKQKLLNNQSPEQDNCIFKSNKKMQITNDQSDQTDFKNQLSQTKTNLQCNLNEAFQIMKSSIFTQKKDLLFESKFQNSFKLKQSQTKNNDIIFSKIKESRRNNRSSNKNKSIDFFKSNQSNNNNENANSDISFGDRNCYNISDKVSSFENKQKKASSKFHNLKKLFMYKLLATFNTSNLIEIGVPEMIKDILLQLIVKLKISAKKSKELKRKTEFFSQAHYNALFLFLNEKTICELAKNTFEVYIHKVIFQIDLEEISQQYLNPKISLDNQSQQDEKNESYLISLEEKIQYVNILKRYCYQVVQSSNMFGVNSKGSQCSTPLFKENSSETPSTFSDQQNSLEKQKNDQELMKDRQLEQMRMAYTYRALQGISSLSRGIFVKKF